MFTRLVRKAVVRTFAPLVLVALVAGCSSSESATPGSSPSNDAAATSDATGAAPTAQAPLQALAGLWNLSQSSGGATFEGYLNIDADGTTALYAADPTNNCFVAVRGTLTPRQDGAFDFQATGPGGSVENVFELALQGTDSLVVVTRGDGARLVAPRVVQFTVESLEGLICTGSAAPAPGSTAPEPDVASQGTWTEALANVTMLELESGNSTFTRTCTFFDPNGRFRQEYHFTSTGTGSVVNEFFGSWSATGSFPDERSTVSLAFDDGDGRQMILEFRSGALIVDGSQVSLGSCNP